MNENLSEEKSNKSEDLFLRSFSELLDRFVVFFFFCVVLVWKIRLVILCDAVDFIHSCLCWDRHRQAHIG